jgi:hypothetical protein
MMAELFPIGLPEQISCVEDEIALRRSVYARRVDDRKMTREKADKRIAAMEAVLATLKGLQ